MRERVPRRSEAPRSLSPRLVRSFQHRRRPETRDLRARAHLPCLTPSGILPFLAWSVVACSRAPRPVLPVVIPGNIPVDVRVRVIARELAGGWHPGRLIRSAERCRVVTVAVARQPEPIVLLNMGQIRRLQLSQANPPPDWWVEPAEAEGWTEIDPARLREQSERCRSQYPPGAQY